MTQANYIRKTYVLCTYIQRNRYICTCIALRGVLTQESQGLITYAFVMLLLAMISLHMLTFRSMPLVKATEAVGVKLPLVEKETEQCRQFTSWSLSQGVQQHPPKLNNQTPHSKVCTKTQNKNYFNKERHHGC